MNDKSEIYKRPDPWDPALVLQGLGRIRGVNSISIDINQIIFHSATSDEEVRYHYEKGRPEYVLGQLGLSCQCTELCAWSLEEYPKVLIHHSAIRELLLESMQYSNDHERWKLMVGKIEEEPEYKAFDYTAEFHSRDVSDPDCDCTSLGPLLDLGLWGVGKYRCGSTSGLSMRFAQDFISNTQFFGRNPWAWRPDLYKKMREKYGSVSSVVSLEACSG